MIEISNLKFRYPTSDRNILDIPNFSISSGEKVFLYGPSGSGKSTFLEILSGINVPQEGSIKMNDVAISELSSFERDTFRANYIGYIFQIFNLVPYLSVKENILLPLHFSAEKRKNVPAESENSEVENICLKLGIGDLINRNVSELSIGQQQRVAAARAIIGRPKLILADEPTSSLDFDHREKFIQLLFSVCEQYKITVLFVSHDRTLEKLFDRSISLQKMNHFVPKSDGVNL